MDWTVKSIWSVGIPHHWKILVLVRYLLPQWCWRITHCNELQGENFESFAPRFHGGYSLKVALNSDRCKILISWICHSCLFLSFINLHCLHWSCTWYPRDGFSLDNVATCCRNILTWLQMALYASPSCIFSTQTFLLLSMTLEHRRFLVSSRAACSIGKCKVQAPVPTVVTGCSGMRYGFKQN